MYYIFEYFHSIIVMQVIKNIRNVTRHRNGQSVNKLGMAVVNFQHAYS